MHSNHHYHAIVEDSPQGHMREDSIFRNAFHTFIDSKRCAEI